MNTQHARDFIAWLGHCNLIAAKPNWEEHMSPPDGQDPIDWAARANRDGYNIYFSVNPTRAKGKGTKADIIEARYVHCDVDPPTDIEQVAAIAKQQEVSCVFRSGRGLGILVKLTTPVKDLTQVEMINRKLIVGYGTEQGTHNIDRILKLPGSRAYMSDKKKLAGYNDCDTYVEHWIQDTASIEELAAMLRDVEVTIRAEKPQRITHANASNEQMEFRLRSEGQWDVSSAADASTQLAKMLRICAKLSTNESQVKDLILSSPYAVHGPDTSDGKQTRAQKIQRIWDNEWLKAVLDTEHHRSQAKSAVQSQLVENRLPTQDIPQAAKPTIYDARPIGLLGDMYDFFLEHAVAPNPVFALAGAKTMLAGIIGRQYQVSGTGLQFFNVVLAPSGTGKQSATSGIRAIEHALRQAIPVLWDRHSGPTMLASAPGMQTLLAEKPAVYAVLNEYATTLSAITNHKSNETTRRLKGALLDLFTASSPGTIFGAAWYSDREKKKDPVISPAFSFLGDAVAEDFNEVVDADSIKDGFLPRHSLYVYSGMPPKANRNRRMQPPPQLVNTLAKIIVHIQELETREEFINIPLYSVDLPSELHDKYSIRKAKEIGVADPAMPVFQRVAHKILREAALTAFSRWAAGMGELMVTESDIGQAEAFVLHQSDYMISAMRSGNLGRGSNAREAKVLEVMQQWSRDTKEKRIRARAPQYSVDHRDIVPQKYIIEKLKRNKLFDVDERMNAGEMVRRTIGELVLQGTIHELSPEQVLAVFPDVLVRAPLYRVEV